jgi:hypothetical protein
MLGPKHTAREAAAILVAGLRDGSISLSEQPDVTVDLEKERLLLQDFAELLEASEEQRRSIDNSIRMLEQLAEARKRATTTVIRPRTKVQ